MSKKLTRGLLCFVPTLLGLLLWFQLPNEMPVHFGMLGEVDRFASKVSVVFTTPIILFVLHILFTTIVEIYPKWFGYKGMRKSMYYLMPLISFIVFFISYINSR